MPIALTTVLLCDHAQVREGLLFVHSGGVSRVVPSAYPASIRVHLALVIHVPAAEAVGSHTIDLRFKYPDSAELIASAQVEMQMHGMQGTYPGEGINIPQVIDLSMIPFPRPGQVDVQISVAPSAVDREAAELGLEPTTEPVDVSFWLLPPAGQPTV